MRRNLKYISIDMMYVNSHGTVPTSIIELLSKHLPKRKKKKKVHVSSGYRVGRFLPT